MSAGRRIRLLITTSLALLLALANAVVAVAGDAGPPLPK